MSPGEEKQRVLRTKKFPPSNADCLGIREPQLPGDLRACPGMYRKVKVKVHFLCMRHSTMIQKVAGSIPEGKALRLCTGRTTHGGSRGIALLFHDHGTRRE
jgi:hypothetical protein